MVKIRGEEYTTKPMNYDQARDIVSRGMKNEKYMRSVLSRFTTISAAVIDRLSYTEVRKVMYVVRGVAEKIYADDPRNKLLSQRVETRTTPKVVDLEKTVQEQGELF